MRWREHRAPLPEWLAGVQIDNEVEPALGYVSVPAGTAPSRPGTDVQAAAIERACAGLGLELGQLMRDPQPPLNGHWERPALRHALEVVVGGQASALVVARLDCLAGSAAAIGSVVEWFEHNDARLIAADVALDTAAASGQVTARALVAAGRLEGQKLGDRTRKGLAAARSKGVPAGRPAVADRPELRERIRSLRDAGRTLQAIADQLNTDGEPTLRGGAKWRPSSVQATAGYKRPGAGRRSQHLPPA